MVGKNRIVEIDNLKKKIDQYHPLDAYHLQQLKEYFRIGLTYTSNAIEGNTLTETETKIILEDGLTIGGKTLREHFEVVGHSKAFDVAYELAKNKIVTEQDILALHRFFYYLIDQPNAGFYRQKPIIVTGTDFIFPKPVDVPGLMQNFVQELVEMSKQLHPVELAALAHLKFVMIHPFIDGNGRTARLLMNVLLMQHGYVVTIIPPIMRQHYFSAIKQGNDGHNESFINFISEMVYESHKEYLRLLKG